MFKTNKVFAYFLSFIAIFTFSSCEKESITTEENIFTPIHNYLLGNPTNATTQVSNPDNYLIEKKQYVLSYNNTRGTANWVSWYLSDQWNGSAERQNNFRPDTDLPTGFFRAVTSDYTNTGFDRGHLCPSADRDLSEEDNAATFFMSNIIPQAPHVNQGNWAKLENYSRDLVDNGSELYIIAGAYGIGGTGNNGGRTKTIANGNITVPAQIWKIIVILPKGANDVSRVGTYTRVIAVDIPNKNSANDKEWSEYRTSVRAIENATGYDFLSKVPTSIQNVIETQVDALEIK